MNTIKESSAVISVKTAKTVSKAMDVFYNPIMKLNRDISVLLLRALGKVDMRVGLPLAGSGVRGVRLLKELEKGQIKTISFNDYSSDAVKSIAKNLALNSVKSVSIVKKNAVSSKKVQIYCDDANLFLLNSKGFDYIDIDPFGSSNPFLDAAIKRISRDGILAVTNTDTAGLAGANPKVCRRLYWAEPERGYRMHEIGLRILIRKVQLVGMQHGKALIPIFCYFKDHYFRMFFECVKGKQECDKLYSQHGMFEDAGPMWLGPLFDSQLSSKMFSIAKKELDFASNKENSIKKSNNKSNKNKKLKNNSNKEIKIIDNQKELVKFLKIIKDESKIKAVGFFNTHKKGNKKILQKEDLISKLKKKGFKAASTHFVGTGIRTTASEREIKKIK